MRTLGDQFRKLPVLTVHRPSLRLRGDTLWITLEHDGKYQLRKKPWIRIDDGADASDLEILSATKRAIDQYKKAQEGSDLPVASGSLATDRRQDIKIPRGERWKRPGNHSTGTNAGRATGLRKTDGLHVQQSQSTAVSRGPPTIGGQTVTASQCRCVA